MIELDKRPAKYMSRLSITILAAYGFKLSRTATANIRRTRESARDGNHEAREHFTQSRYAHVLGVRNSDLGMVFYAVVALSAISGLIRRRSVLSGLLLGSIASLLMSIYLIWALLFRLRVWCWVCIRAHVTNLALFITLIRLWRSLSGG
jgi:uncharacterized membrane protein